MRSSAQLLLPFRCSAHVTWLRVSPLRRESMQRMHKYAHYAAQKSKQKERDREERGRQLRFKWLMMSTRKETNFIRRCQLQLSFSTLLSPLSFCPHSLLLFLRSRVSSLTHSTALNGPSETEWLKFTRHKVYELRSKLRNLQKNICSILFSW